jgi:hypothetical protein
VQSVDIAMMYVLFMQENNNSLVRVVDELE